MLRAVSPAACCVPCLVPCCVLRAEQLLNGMPEEEVKHTVSNLMVGLAAPAELAMGLPPLSPASLQQQRGGPPPGAGPGGAGALDPADWLIRGIMGFDLNGGLVVADSVRPGQRLRFMVRGVRGGWGGGGRGEARGRSMGKARGKGRGEGGRTRADW